MVGIKEKVFILLEGHGSQKRLAEAIGLTDKAVSAWKKNNAGGDIATETSKKIAKYFNAPLQLLVDDSIKLVEQWRDDQYDDFRIGDDEDKRMMLESWGVPKDLIRKYVGLFYLLVNGAPF